jgi:hypothetical protein
MRKRSNIFIIMWKLERLQDRRVAPVGKPKLIRWYVGFFA